MVSYLLHDILGNVAGLLSEPHEVQVLHVQRTATKERFILELGFGVWGLGLAVGELGPSTSVPRPRNAISTSNANHCKNGKNSHQHVTS